MGNIQEIKNTAFTFGSNPPKTKIFLYNLQEMGWVLGKKTDHFQYLELILDGSVFDLYSLIGRLVDGEFEILGIHNRTFTYLEELQELLTVNRFVIE